MWVSGVHVVKEVLKNKPHLAVEVIFCRKDYAVMEILDQAKTCGIPAKEIGRGDLNRIVGYRRHHGIALRIKAFPYTDFDDLMDQPIQQISPLVLLDGIEDPQNFGSILRSSAFFKAGGVIIPEHRSVSVTDAVSRVSAGAISMLAVVRVPNLVNAMKVIADKGFTIVGLDAHAELSIYDSSLHHPVALVVGNEHRGMRRLVREHCHRIVSIPAKGEMESLNAAVATAVALAEVSRQNR